VVTRGRAVSIDEVNIRRAGVAFIWAVAVGVSSSTAWAAEPAAPPPAAASSDAVAHPVAAGLAVVAVPGASDAAWPLARSVYATASLRPAALDDARARVLCGEAPPPDAPPEIRDLAATVAAITGDDAPSRALLGDIARRLGLSALALVRLDGDRPTARIFLADVGAFDSATYMPDEETQTTQTWSSPTQAPTARTWSGAAQSLARSFGASPVAPDAAPPSPTPPSAIGPAGPGAPALASHEVPKPEGSHSRQFYESGWFWGALGAAAFAGAAVFLATRDSGPSTIHLQLEVSH
jgi:hypothetical protein